MRSWPPSFPTLPAKGQTFPQPRALACACTVMLVCNKSKCECALRERCMCVCVRTSNPTGKRRKSTRAIFRGILQPRAHRWPQTTCLPPSPARATGHRRRRARHFVFSPTYHLASSRGNSKHGLAAGGHQTPRHSVSPGPCSRSAEAAPTSLTSAPPSRLTRLARPR